MQRVLENISHDLDGGQGQRIYTQTKKIRPIFMVLYLLIQLRCLSKKYTKMFIKRPTHKSWLLFEFILLSRRVIEP